jgi:hypothetical protein
VPRVPSPASGVTSNGELSSNSWAGITRPSSLLRTHAPVLTPHDGLGLKALCRRSLQVAVSPCWDEHLPDVISAILVEAPGPIPRRVPRVPLPVASPRTSASRQKRHVRHAGRISATQLQQRGFFRGCSHSLMFRLPNLLGPPVAPTARPLSVAGGRAVYTTPNPVRYRARVVASLRA